MFEMWTMIFQPNGEILIGKIKLEINTEVEK